MPRLSRVWLVAALVTAWPVTAGQWQERLDRDGITVLSRIPDGKDFEEFRATVSVGASLPAALALLRDNAACTRWLFRCKESRLIEAISPTERTFYQRTGLPFPARDRDAVFHARISFDAKRVQVTMTARPELLPETRHVRLRDAWGTYLLEPTDSEKTKITWQQYVDPAGALPRWLVNSMLTDLPYRSLKAFRELVTRPPYSNAAWIVDDNGNRVGITTTPAASGQTRQPPD